MKRALANPNFRIRVARPTDADQISRLLYEWLSFENEGRKLSIKKSISEREILVGTNGKSTVGLIHGIVHNDPISGGTRLFITALYVKENYRNIGIGSSLLRAMVSKAAKEEHIVGVEVSTIRRRVLSFYKRKFGFVHVKGEIREVFLELDLK